MVRYSYVIIILLNLNLFTQIAEAKQKSRTGASRVCIIGAGYSGLATARYMKENGLNFTVFESTQDIGGTWKFQENVGTDEFGTPLRSNQYKNLRTNAPRQILEFKDFPFPEDTPSFVAGTCFHKYFNSFVKHFNLTEHIQLKSLVTWVQRTGDRWQLTYTKTAEKQNVTEECDFVVVASGEYSLPNMPQFKGQEKFTGLIQHSHEFKDAEKYRGKRVLIVGGGPSGLDIAVHLANITSKLVHSHHLVYLHGSSYSYYNQPDFPDTYIKKPDLKHFTEHGAVFKDDSAEEFDVVIFCTGFNFAYPFLSDLSSGLTLTGNYVMPLYKHTVNINQPTMTFIGIGRASFMRMLDIQAEYSAALASGRFKLPSKDKMIMQWLLNLKALGKIYVKRPRVNQIDFNPRKYLNDLQKEAGLPLLAPVYTIMGNFNLKNLFEDNAHFRDYEHRILSDIHYERKYNPRNVTCPLPE